MANDDQAAALGGLRPVNQPYGTIKRSYYRIATGSANQNLFIGQPMDLDTNGEAVVATHGTAGDSVLIGPIIGFSRDSRGQMGLPDGMSLITQGAYLPSYTKAYVCIADDPNQEFIPKVKGMRLSDGSVKAGLLEDMSPLLPLEVVEQCMVAGINEQSKTITR